MEPSYKFSYEIHKNFSYEFHMNNEKAPYEFDMKFMTCVCWERAMLFSLKDSFAALSLFKKNLISLSSVEAKISSASPNKALRDALDETSTFSITLNDF